MNPLANLQQFNIAGNAQNALMQGMQVGDAMRQRRMAEERQAAEDGAYVGLMTGDKSGINALAKIPGAAKDAYTLQQGVQTQEANQMEADRKRLAQVADLLDNSTDEVSYQRNLNVARQLGLPVDAAPPNFDPEFVKTQSAIARAVLGNDPELPLIGQEAMLKGLIPGTPEFQAEIGRMLAAKYDPSKTLSFQPGGGAVAYNTATGQITPLIVPGGTENGGGAQPITKVIGGNTYYQVDGKWYDELPQGGSVGNGAGPFQGGL